MKQFANQTRYCFHFNPCNRIVHINRQVESLTNQEEVELRAKIKALGLEVTKLPAKPTEPLDEVCAQIKVCVNVE